MGYSVVCIGRHTFPEWIFHNTRTTTGVFIYPHCHVTILEVIFFIQSIESHDVLYHVHQVLPNELCMYIAELSTWHVSWKAHRISQYNCCNVPRKCHRVPDRIFQSTWKQMLYSISQEICTRFCCALLCCGYVIVHTDCTWSTYPYLSGLLCWHWGNR